MCEAPIETAPGSYARQPGDPAAAAKLLSELEIQTLIPRLQLNEQTAEILRQSPDASDKAYLKRQTANAKQLITCLENRQNTLALLLDEIVRRQKDFFLSGAPFSDPASSAGQTPARPVPAAACRKALPG